MLLSDLAVTHLGLTLNLTQCRWMRIRRTPLDGILSNPFSGVR
jgi:hypothetical protein